MCGGIKWQISMYTGPVHPSVHEIYFILVKINGLNTAIFLQNLLTDLNWYWKSIALN